MIYYSCQNYMPFSFYLLIFASGSISKQRSSSSSASSSSAALGWISSLTIFMKSIEKNELYINYWEKKKKY